VSALEAIAGACLASAFGAASGWWGARCALERQLRRAEADRLADELCDLGDPLDPVEIIESKRRLFEQVRRRSSGSPR
jgi:hypothetical protein